MRTNADSAIAGCCTFAVGKSETPRVVRNTPKEIQISPKVNKIINAKKNKKDYD